jgi:predicted DNA-binding ArsR family transcriptional regulator
MMDNTHIPDAPGGLRLVDAGHDVARSRTVPDPETVLEALDDEDCREMICRVTQQPMTARELSTACDLPLSTTYRKLELLNDASLLEGQTRICTDGKNAQQYVRAFDRVLVDIREDGTLEVAVRTGAEQ